MYMSLLDCVIYLFKIQEVFYYSLHQKFSLIFLTKGSLAQFQWLSVIALLLIPVFLVFSSGHSFSLVSLVLDLEKYIPPLGHLFSLPRTLSWFATGNLVCFTFLLSQLSYQLSNKSETHFPLKTSRPEALIFKFYSLILHFLQTVSCLNSGHI